MVNVNTKLNNMKIAVFYNLPIGGAYRVVYEEIKFISKYNDVDVYTYQYNDNHLWNIKKYARKIYEYPFNILTKKCFLSRLFNDLKIFLYLPLLNRYIAKVIKAKKYNIVIVHPDKFTQAPHLLRYLKTPSIYFCEELLRNAYEKILAIDKSLPFYKYFYEKTIRTLKKYFDKLNASNADLIMTASVYIKNNVKCAYNKDAIVNRLGVDTNIFFRKSSKKEKYILFIGQKEFLTGYFFAEALFKNINIREMFQLKTINYKNNTFQLTDNDMAILYSKAFLTLCVDYGDPFGLGSIESMACGTPVLAVNEAAYNELLIIGCLSHA
jgi:glycosyltransferase involved in cell wall biosynthesis